MFYFAYGSNLDADNWSRWCEAKGYDPASIEPIGRAWLPDYEPVFHYQSRLRRGGALDVRPRKGAVTPGALFRVHAWAGLDAKEGVGGRFYRRFEATVLTEDGRAHLATSYRVCDHRVGEFVPPGFEYRQIVLRGLSRFAHGSEQFLAAARGASPPDVIDRVFAYGTLMQGQSRHDLIAPRVRRTQVPARMQGASLVRVDWYPGLVLTSGSEVHGQVFQLDDLRAAFEELDAYEDFQGYAARNSLYRRSIVSVATPKGSTLAWTYVYLGDVSQLPVIESGRWSAA